MATYVDVDVAVVRRLLAAQLPEWAQLPLTPVDSAGTDNALYRLGEDLCVRLPRVDWAIEQVAKEHRWLPALAPRLPLAVPEPLVLGAPGEGYPWQWSVYRWLEGENATLDRVDDASRMATELARFVAALQQIDPAGGPPPGAHNVFRGVPLAARDAYTREALGRLGGYEALDVAALTRAWQGALEVPAWEGPPVWFHGDLQPGNLLARHGRLSAVIDFGLLGVGDPAADLIVAWNLFTAETREVFRSGLSVDEATWQRGRGLALSVGLVALPYYWDTNPVIVAASLRAIQEVLADLECGA